MQIAYETVLRTSENPAGVFYSLPPRGIKSERVLWTMKRGFYAAAVKIDSGAKPFSLYPPPAALAGFAHNDRFN